MLFWDESKHAAHVYEGESRYVLGTSLLYRKDYWAAHRFNGIDVGEDNTFVRRARGVLKVHDGFGLMVATTHKNGTSPRQLGKRWVPAEKSAIPEDYWNL